MSFMVWSESYSLGIKNVDEQHEHLFKLVNKLHDSVMEGLEQNTLSDILDELIEYTVYHFESEEEMFRQHDYPKLEEHVDEHNRLTEEVIVLQSKFYAHEVTITYEVLDFLREWLNDHTTRTDMEFSEFYKERKGNPSLDLL